MNRKTLLTLAVLLAASSQIHADVKMHGLFGDHMVLQSDIKIPVWGWADPGEEVSVTFGNARAGTRAGADGKWRVDLAKTAATAEPQVLTITGKNAITFEDVLVGDVWLCSGQSNMEFGVFNVAKKEEVVDTQIRTFCMTKAAALTPLDNTQFVPAELVWDTGTGHWQKENPSGPWGGFSAIGYLFGKEIRKVTKHPVGLIGSYWGGTPVEAWTSLAAFENEPTQAARMKEYFSKMTPEHKGRFPVVWADYVAAMRKWSAEVWEPDNVALRKWEADVKKAQADGTPEPPKPQPSGQRPHPPANEGTPTTLFNGMINPLVPYAMKGVIWYQGESNVGNREYDVLFTTMIKDWRERWGQGDFPFLFVQLAGYGNGTQGNWAALRDQQRQALALPNTAMAVAIDVGDFNDIHPKNKVPVARRLALAARHLAYGEDINYIGPTYASMAADGKSLRVAFSDVGKGLTLAAAPAMPGETALPAPTELRGFEIAGADEKWFVAKAVIDGATVLVSSDQVAEPVAVRYAWGDAPFCDLYSRDGLPAVPFRTDAWNSNAAFPASGIVK